MKALNNQTVGRIVRPVKILQFGEGNFLRAFVDWMIQKANDCGVMNHGVVAVQPIAKGMASQFKQQDSLYHVYLEGIKNKQPIKEVTLVDCIQDVINPYEDYSAYEALFLSEELEIIISNTTEAGIRYEEGDDINACPPQSFPTKMTALLYQRFQKYKGATDKGLHIVCCELIENNGSTLKQYIIKHAKQNNLSAFIEWVNESCFFYDTLVDRIVTGFPKNTINEIKRELGYDDNLVVVGEYFHVWAIGGNPAIKEKLPLDKAGLNVLFLEDITEFRKKKVRILNGAHTAMVPVALLMGLETVKDAFTHPLIETYIRKMVSEEVLPTLDGDRQALDDFASSILERFYNPYIRHYLKDISLNSLSKWETRNFPVLKDTYAGDRTLAQRTAFSFAALLVLYSGAEASDFTPNDTPEFVEFIRSSFNRSDIETWVSGIVGHPEMWENELSQAEGFIPFVTSSVTDILSLGIEKALEKYGR
ncbi:tagaturonate reductase [Massilibacteroides sp.]|uniref:tagaturonate reductase n=1 Tax=Massilibacteroides sp. TaxID=2034766 RepID=UPI00260F4A14|nr:tagaturonate reductase [Massilibacteroides sp.]MDD4513969.1 tagaturonate reductase [Massilibacteroides sp.]